MVFNKKIKEMFERHTTYDLLFIYKVEKVAIMCGHEDYFRTFKGYRP